MDYRKDFDIFAFRFYGKAYTYLQGLQNSERVKLRMYIEEHFAGCSPLECKINQFVSEECDEFFERLKRLREQTE